jgi:hypothetical protein
MTIDITKIKPGDKITVELTVKGRDGYGYFRSEGIKSINPNFVGNHIDPGDIVSHTPKPVEIVVGTVFTPYIGDRRTSGNARVIAVAEGWCLVKYHDKSVGSMDENHIRGLPIVS